MATLRASRVLPPLPTGLKDDPAMQATQQQQVANAIRANNLNNQSLADQLSGVTGTVILAKLTPSGTPGSLTFTAGILVSATDAT